MKALSELKSLTSQIMKRFFEAYAEKIEETDGDQQEQTALGRAVVTQFEQYIKLNKKIPPKY